MRKRFYTFSCGALIAAALVLFPGSVDGESSSSQNLNPHVVLVTVKTHGLYLSHNKLKPGVVRFLVENGTPLKNPTITVTPTSTGQSAQSVGSASVEKPVDSDRGSHSWTDVTLTPGVYTVQLTSIPSLRVQVTVAP